MEDGQWAEHNYASMDNMLELRRQLRELPEQSRALEERNAELTRKLKETAFSASIIGQDEKKFYFYSGLDYQTFMSFCGSFEHKLASWYLSHGSNRNLAVEECY